MIRKILFIILGLFLVQILTFLLIGRRSLIASFDSSYSEFIIEKPPTILIVYCNWGQSAEVPENYDAYEIKYENMPKLSENEESKLKLKLGRDFQSVVLVNHRDDLAKLFNDRSVLYYLCMDYTSYFTAYVDESVQLKEKDHDSLIVSDWQSKYVWILFQWVKIKKTNTGIS